MTKKNKSDFKKKTGIETQYNANFLKKFYKNALEKQEKDKKKLPKVGIVFKKQKIQVPKAPSISKLTSLLVSKVKKGIKPEILDINKSVLMSNIKPLKSTRQKLEEAKEQALKLQSQEKQNKQLLETIFSTQLKKAKPKTVSLAILKKEELQNKKEEEERLLKMSGKDILKFSENKALNLISEALNTLPSEIKTNQKAIEKSVLEISTILNKELKEEKKDLIQSEKVAKAILNKEPEFLELSNKEKQETITELRDAIKEEKQSLNIPVAPPVLNIPVAPPVLNISVPPPVIDMPISTFLKKESKKEAKRQEKTLQDELRDAIQKGVKLKPTAEREEQKETKKKERTLQDELRDAIQKGVKLKPVEPKEEEEEEPKKEEVIELKDILSQAMKKMRKNIEKEEEQEQTNICDELKKLKYSVSYDKSNQSYKFRKSTKEDGKTKQISIGYSSKLSNTPENKNKACLQLVEKEGLKFGGKKKQKKNKKKCLEDELLRCIEYPKAPNDFIGNKSNWRKNKQCLNFGCIKPKPKKKETEFQKECKKDKFIIRCNKYTKGKTNKKCVSFGCYFPQKENYFWKSKKPVKKIVSEIMKQTPEVVSKLTNEEKKQVEKEIKKEVEKETKKEVEKETKKEVKKLSKKQQEEQDEYEYQRMRDKMREESRAEDFYNVILPMFGTGKITSRSLNQILKESEKYGFDKAFINELLSLREIGFFPTGNSCIKTITDDILKDFGKDLKLNILEGTSGLGNVAFKISQNMPNSKIRLNEIVSDLLNFSKNLLDWNPNLTFTNDNFFNIQNGDWDILFLNPPYTAKNKPKYWLEFLLHGLKLLNKSKKKNKTLYLISPTLGLDFSVSSLLEIIKTPDNPQKRLTLTPEDLRKAINELENTNYSKNDFADDDKLTDIIEPYQFRDVELLGKCNDFIGTKITADIYKFNLI
jgi:hypothetical protein